MRIMRKFKEITKKFAKNVIKNIREDLIRSYAKNLIKGGINVDINNKEHMKVVENLYDFVLEYRNKTRSFSRHINFNEDEVSKLSETRIFKLFGSTLVPVNYNPIIGLLGDHAYEIANVHGLKNDDKHYVIFVDDAFYMLSEQAQNFVIAHEISHFVYGDTDVNKRDNVSDDIREIRADVLAATDCIKNDINPLACFDEMMNVTKRHPVYGSFKDDEQIISINSARRQALEEFCVSIKE